MPELEEGNLWIRGTFPLNISLERRRQGVEAGPRHHDLLPRGGGRRQSDRPARRRHRPDGYYNVEFFVPLRPQKDWPAVVEQTGWRRWLFGAKRPRTKDELVKRDERRADAASCPASTGTSRRTSATTSWRRCPASRATTRSRSSAPTWTSWSAWPTRCKDKLQTVPGIEDVGIFRIKGQTNLEFRVDLEKCKKWGVSAADVNNVIQTALGGKALTTMIEGEKIFDIALRWPLACAAARRRSSTSRWTSPTTRWC